LTRSHILLVCLYIPPNTPSGKYEAVLNILNDLCENYSESLIVGDFNIPNLVTHYRTGSSSANIGLLNDFLSFNNMTQYNSIQNVNNRLLDLIISPTSNTVLVTHADSHIVTEDAHHPCLAIELTLNKKQFLNLPYSPSTPSLDFSRANLNALYANISTTNWEAIFPQQDVDSCIDSFYKSLNSIIVKHVPSRRIHSKSKYPCWFSLHTIKLIKLRNNLLSRFRRQKYLSQATRIKSLRMQIKAQSANDYANFINTVEQNIKSDSSSLWKFINQRRNTSRIPLNMSFKKIGISDPAEIVNAFSDFFRTSYPTNNSTDSSSSTPLSTYVNSNALFTFPIITKTDVEEAASHLSPNMTSGPDGIPSFLAKDCITCLSDTLAQIFNLCVKTSTYPAIWKLSKIIPVHKGNSKHDIENYRPISLISNFAKIFDIIISKLLNPFAMNILSQSQHGFIKGRSTNTNLITFTQFVSDALAQHLQVDVIYLDFMKAFDSVDHNVLLEKLSKYGFDNDTVQFFSSYLSNRKQYVSIKGHNSTHYSANSGVIQGSNLGPLLFNLFINDLTSVIQHSQCLLYADDVKLYKVIYNPYSCQELQSDIDSIHEWCTLNKLFLNQNKCSSIQFRRIKSTIDFSYSIENNSIKQLSAMRDLGIYFQNDLSFNKHVDQIRTNAFKMMGFLSKVTIDFRSVDCLVKLFTTYIRSSMEYGAIIWDPYYKCHIQTLERV